MQNFDERSGGRRGQPEDSGKQYQEYTAFYCPEAQSVTPSTTPDQSIR
jgi:hypothetical protein